VELIGRQDGRQAHALVCPLLTTTAGTKFGKSEGGNVWLDPALTSPYRFYQFWLNTDDRDVERLLRFFTFLPLEKIARVMEDHAADPGRRQAQRLLADEVTTTVHGSGTTRRAAAASAILFGGGALREADADTLAVVAGEVQVHTVRAAELDAGLPIADALLAAGLASSKAEARRGLQQKGFAVNGEKVDGPDRTLGPDDLLAGGYIVLQKGRRHYAMVAARGD
jgi:tyrosyl-tRNA synthetase